MGGQELKGAIQTLQDSLQPLRQGEFSERIGKISVYAASIGKSWDALLAALSGLEEEKAADPGRHRQAVGALAESFRASAKNSLRFARINLDAALREALDRLVKRPRSANRSDEQKKSLALKRVFDGSPDPGKAMRQHYRASSDPLDKWLVAGPWGHEYLKKRSIDLEDYDLELCGLLSCGETAAGRIILGYSNLSRALKAVEEAALRSAKVFEGSSALE